MSSIDSNFELNSNFFDRNSEFAVPGVELKINGAPAHLYHQLNCQLVQAVSERIFQETSTGCYIRSAFKQELPLSHYIISDDGQQWQKVSPARIVEPRQGTEIRDLYSDDLYVCEFTNYGLDPESIPTRKLVIDGIEKTIAAAAIIFAMVV